MPPISKLMLYGGAAIAALLGYSYIKQASAANAANSANSSPSGYMLPQTASFAPLSLGGISSANDPTGGSSGQDTASLLAFETSQMLANQQIANAQLSSYMNISAQQNVFSYLAQWLAGLVGPGQTSGHIDIPGYGISFNVSSSGSFNGALPSFIPSGLPSISGNPSASSDFNVLLASAPDIMASDQSASLYSIPNSGLSNLVSLPTANPVIPYTGGLQDTGYYAAPVYNPTANVYYSAPTSISNGAAPAPIDPNAVTSGSPLYNGAYTVGFLPDGSFQYADGSTLPAPSYIVPSNYQGFGIDENGNPVGWD